MLKYSKLTTNKQNKILQYFCVDLDATKTAKFLNLNRKTINKYFNFFREEIVRNSIRESKFSGEVELDESYFGAKRVRGKRGRGAAGKTPVFGILKRGGKVFVSVVKKCSRAELLPIIQGKILEGSTIHTDGWRARACPRKSGEWAHFERLRPLPRFPFAR